MLSQRDFDAFGLIADCAGVIDRASPAPHQDQPGTGVHLRQGVLNRC